jgi:hypothetical protein
MRDIETVEKLARGLDHAELCSAILNTAGEGMASGRWWPDVPHFNKNEVEILRAEMRRRGMGGLFIKKTQTK